MYEGQFQEFLNRLNRRTETTQYQIWRIRAKAGSKIDKLRVELVKSSKDLNWWKDELDEFKANLNSDADDDEYDDEFEYFQEKINDIQRQMALIQREIDELESEGGGGNTVEDDARKVTKAMLYEPDGGGGGTVEDDALYEPDGGGGGTVEDDALYEPDGKYQNLSMGVYYH